VRSASFQVLSAAAPGGAPPPVRELNLEPQPITVFAQCTATWKLAGD
jgi:hypothetical protein